MRGISAASQNQDLRTLKILQLWTESCDTNLLCIMDRKQTQIKTQTSRFTWFPKTGYVHGGSKLYIIGGMIQTLNSTPVQSQNPVFHSYTRCFSQICSQLSKLHLLHTPLHLHPLLLSLSPFIGEMRALKHAINCGTNGASTKHSGGVLLLSIKSRQISTQSPWKSLWLIIMWNIYEIVTI